MVIIYIHNFNDREMLNSESKAVTLSSFQVGNIHYGKTMFENYFYKCVKRNNFKWQVKERKWLFSLV